VASASHLSCGDVVQKSTTLDSDLTCAGDGLIIGRDGVSLNLGGHTISGSQAGVGIDNSGHDRVRIANGTVTGFSVGVRLTQADRNRLSGLRAVGNQDGVVLSSSDRTTVVDSDFSNNGFGPSDVGDGVAITSGSDRTTIRRTTARGNEGRGIFIGDSRDTVVAGSSAGGGIAGLEAHGAPRTIVRRSTFDSGFTTVVLQDSDRSSITQSHIDGGLRSDSDDVRIAGTTTNGMEILGDDNSVVRSTATLNAFGSGILVTGGGALIAHNVANVNAADGITITAPGTVVRGNTANDNLDLGINAVPGVIDRGHNKASGNGNPLQCLNVDCE
jgi:parallel beta-helix repeat protein